MYHKVILFLLILISYQYISIGQVYSYKDASLGYGKYKVGFQTLQFQSKAGDSVLVSLWYPDEEAGKSLTLKDLITLESDGTLKSDSLSLNDFRNIVERIYDIKVPQEKFLKAIEIPIRAQWQAKMKSGNYPLIIGQSQPISYFPIFEYLASRGYVIATAHCTFSVPFVRGPLRYTPETNVLNELLDFMISKSYVNTSNISAFGHGGGIQSATYLAMRTSKIKRVINVDGGFFGPRSNTTISVEYRPEQLQVPFLHFITDSQFLQDDSTQFNTLKNPIIRTRLVSKSVYHHDFTAFGQVHSLINENKERNTLINDAVHTANQVILQFLKGKPIKDGKWKLIKIEKFN